MGENKPLLVQIDYEKHLHHLEQSNASDEEKLFYIRMLADILIGFVDLGFGVHPVQQAQNIGGKEEEISPETPPTAPDELYSYPQHVLSENFEDAADLESSAEGRQS